MPTLRDELGLWEANRQDECPYPTRLFAQNAGRKKCQETRLYLKKRNEHRLGGKILPAGVGRWPTSSLNLASEPRTPPVWMCARWVVSIRQRDEPMTMADGGWL